MLLLVTLAWTVEDETNDTSINNTNLITNAIKIANASKSQWQRNPNDWLNLLSDVNLDNWQEYPWPPGTPITETFANKPNQWYLDTQTGILHCSAKYHSHLLTKKDYKNFVLHVEFRYRNTDKSGSNSGIFVRMLSGEHVMHQIELADTSATLFGGSLSDGVLKPFKSLVPGPSGAWQVGKVHTPRDWQKHVIKRISVANPSPPQALGQSQPVIRHSKSKWNTVEITCVGNHIIVWMNGGITAYTDQCKVPEGAIGLESEGYPIDFRNIKIKPY